MDLSNYAVCWLVGGFRLQSGWLMETAGSGGDRYPVRDRTRHGPEKRQVHAFVRYIEKNPVKFMVL